MKYTYRVYCILFANMCIFCAWNVRHVTSIYCVWVRKQAGRDEWAKMQPNCPVCQLNVVLLQAQLHVLLVDP